MTGPDEKVPTLKEMVELMDEHCSAEPYAEPLPKLKDTNYLAEEDE